MSLNKKVLAAAIVGALASSTAFAADLSAVGGAVPAYFAKEIVASPTARATLQTSASAATSLTWEISYNFSADEVRYARVQCSDNLRFDTATTVASDTPAAAAIGSINGLGTSALTFSVTSLAAGGNIQGDHVFSVVGDHQITGTDQDVTCSVALYDQPSQAQNGGTVGLIQNTHYTGAYISFAPSYELSVTPTTHVANVEATPTFSQFIINATTAPTAQQARLGANTLAFRLRDPDGAGVGQTATFGVDGNLITLGDLFAAGTNLIVEGDYSMAASAGATPFDATSRTRVLLGATNASALTANSATFNNVQGGFAGTFVELNKRVATAAIPVSDYMASVRVVGADPTVYAVTDIAPRRIASIVRNGTELQAPLAQIPDGWYSRVILTNTSGVERPYAISVMTEKDVTVATGTLTGTIPANGTKVIDDVKDIFTGHNRATLNVSVAGPTNAIQGMYQIVNPTSGSISNHVMVRPGSN